MLRYTAGMFDDTLLLSPSARSSGVLDTMRAAVSRLGRRRVERVSAAPCAWMAPPPERPLPRDLNLPLSAFDPGALRRCTAVKPVSAAAFVDPLLLERTLYRIPAR
ncbi:hypothetical protein [Sphingomonas phyllosphaerae]|uniref:hypothetical protein n=1 Tax=Sphingomonas phyllosphaerae TaxID=257003 RepID=UPI000413856D|nr:hypothetical protein [Sphingomonas phyllosphaerae]